MIRKTIFIGLLCASTLASAAIFAPQSIRCTGDTIASCHTDSPIDPNFRLVKEGKIIPGVYPFTAGKSQYYVDKDRRELTQFTYYGSVAGSAVLFFESITNNIEADTDIANKWQITGKHAYANGGLTNSYPMKVVFTK